MLNPFLPLTGQASFNAIRIMDIPGVAIDPDVRGRTAYELLSKPALTDLIRSQIRQLGLSPGQGNLIEAAAKGELTLACGTDVRPVGRQTGILLVPRRAAHGAGEHTIRLVPPPRQKALSM